MNPTKRTRGRTLQTMRALHLRRHPLCVMCKARGRVAEATDLDHILPLFKGGTDDQDNLQGLCAECHKDKTRADLGQKAKPAIGLDGWPI